MNLFVQLLVKLVPSLQGYKSYLSLTKSYANPLSSYFRKSWFLFKSRSFIDLQSKNSNSLPLSIPPTRAEQLLKLSASTPPRVPLTETMKGHFSCAATSQLGAQMIVFFETWFFNFLCIRSSKIEGGGIAKNIFFIFIIRQQLVIC